MANSKKRPLENDEINPQFSSLLNDLSIYAYSKLVDQHKDNFVCANCGEIPEEGCYVSCKCEHCFCESCAEEMKQVRRCRVCKQALSPQDIARDPRYFVFYQCYKRTSQYELGGKPLSVEYLDNQKGPRYNFLLQEECRKLFSRNNGSPAKVCPDLENVKLLLNYGANPNVLNKDGGTLLHEAVDYGHVEVLQLLLHGGGLVNAYSLDRFTTCLHDALEDDVVNMSIVKLLLAHGADIEARDRTGLTARRKAEMKDIDLVALTEPLPKVPDSTVRHRPEDSALFYPSQLSSSKQKLLNDFCHKFKKKQCPRLRVSKEVTHIIVEEDPCQAAFPVLLGILQGCHILTIRWIEECLKRDMLVPPGPYQVRGTRDFPATGVPHRARISAALLEPKLFAGGQFNILDSGERISSEEKEQVIELITAGGGRLLTRTNSCGESIGQSFFYHAHGGPLHYCTVIVLHKTEPKNKGWETIGHFSLKWLHKAIQTYQIAP